MNQLVTQTSKLDKSVARVIKLLGNEAKPGKEIPEKFESIISDTVGQLNSTLRVAFTAVIEKEQPDRETLQEWIVTLKQWGWVLTSTEIFLHWEQSFIEEELLSIINLTPSERALKSWLKSTNSSSETLELLLAENLDLAFSTYGADWSLSLKKFDKKIPLVDRLLARPERPEWLPSCDDIIRNILTKDQDGSFARCCLVNSTESEFNASALAGIFKADLQLFKSVSGQLARIVLENNSSFTTTKVIRESLKDFWLLPVPERKIMASIMAKIAADIILYSESEPSEASDETLNLIAEYTDKLKAASIDCNAEQSPWVLENTAKASKITGSGTHISTEGARIFAVAFEQAEQGLDVMDILAAASENLGMIEFPLEDVATYDPTIHEDNEGGIIPGDTVKIIRKGWMLGGKTIVRSLVKK